MSQEEQGKKTNPTEKLPVGKDDKAPVPGKPAALSDADLDNVAGGIMWNGNVIITDGNGDILSCVSPTASPAKFTKK